MKKDFFKDVLTGSDGKPVEATAFLIYNNSRRTLSSFLDHMNEYSGFVLCAKRNDNGHIETFKTDDLTRDDAIVICVHGSVAVANGK